MHETGHEWWGNSITANDIADMWIQESFCTYSEVLFVECMYGYDNMIKYVENQMRMVRNDKPIVGIPHVHQKEVVAICIRRVVQFCTPFVVL